MIPEDEASSSSSAPPMSDANFHKALGALSAQQLSELLDRNPALKREIDTDIEASRASRPEGANHEDADREVMVKGLSKLSLTELMTGVATGKNRKDMASYKFWKTQPVPKFDEDGAGNQLPDGPIEEKTIDQIPAEPGFMHDGFEWTTMDILDEAHMKEVYTLLNGHYVEDTTSSFRFDYSQELLKW